MNILFTFFLYLFYINNNNNNNIIKYYLFSTAFILVENCCESLKLLFWQQI